MLRPRLNQLRQYPPRDIDIAPDRAASDAAEDLATLPTVALVTPSYQQGAFIRATIDSVLGQAYPKLRYVVMDGGSTDETLDILASYGDRLDWWSGPDRGQADAINKGFARVGGEIMGWVNSDDLLLPGTLAYVARFFRDHPEIDLVYGHRIIIDERGQEVGRWVLPRHDPAALALTDYVPQETMFWRAALWNARRTPRHRFSLCHGLGSPAPRAAGRLPLPAAAALPRLLSRPWRAEDGPDHAS